MASKRMFDRAIIDTDRFMDLPMSSKGMYFLLGLEADDYGFVSPKKVMRIHGGNDDDIKLLVAKSFLIPFESGVVVITDWLKNNWLDSRRLKSTEYQNEYKALFLTENGEYTRNNTTCLASAKQTLRENRTEQSSTEENSTDIQIGETSKTVKLKYGEMQKVLLSESDYIKLTDRLGEKNRDVLITELDLYISSKGKKYSNHYATILAWARKKMGEQKEKVDSGKYKVAFSPFGK